MIKIVIGMISVILANILLGTSLSTLKNNFNTDKLWEGVFKSGCIIIASVLMYLCAKLNPEILAISIAGSETNLEMCMRVLFIAGIIYYAGQDLNKLQKILKIKVNKGEN